MNIYTDIGIQCTFCQLLIAVFLKYESPLANYYHNCYLNSDLTPNYDFTP